MKGTRVNVPISEELHEFLKSMSGFKMMSMFEYVKNILEEHMKKNEKFFKTLQSLREQNEN